MTGRVLMIVKPSDHFVTIISLKDSTGTSSDTQVRYSRVLDGLRGKQ